jgi:hypothetical protein
VRVEDVGDPQADGADVLARGAAADDVDGLGGGGGEVASRGGGAEVAGGDARGGIVGELAGCVLRGDGEGEDLVLIVGGVGVGGDADLLEVGLADGELAGLAGLAQGREEDSDEERDDGDDDEEFDEGEGAAGCGRECERHVRCSELRARVARGGGRVPRRVPGIGIARTYKRKVPRRVAWGK